MARSCRSLLVLGCALAAPAVAFAQVSSTEPIKLDSSGGVTVDYKTKELVFTNVTISQGTNRVQADHARATGLDFANSKWSFEGNVRIDAEPRGNLRSDTAVVEFRDNHIARATATGKPAEFQQKRPGTDQVAHGHANEIVYDMAAGSIRLSNDAWLSDGQHEISAPVLVYNMKEQRVEAATTPGTDQHIHITIGGDAAKGDAAPKPDTSKPPPPAPTPATQP